MARAEHYLPEVYLEEWCTDGALCVHQRHEDGAPVHQYFTGPRAIAKEKGLYDLPAGGIANGFVDDKIEDMLGARVDGRIKGIRERAVAASGVVATGLRDDLIWLMKTFVVRAPSTIARLEQAGVEVVAENAALIKHLMDRALNEESRTALRQLRDSRRPKVHARALVAATAANDLPPDLDWLVGDVQVVPFANVSDALHEAGAREFVTFDDPVVSWSDCSYGLRSTFVLSPATLVLLVEPGRTLTAAQCADAATQHTLRALNGRRFLITRSKATGQLLAAAGRLTPIGAKRDGS